MASEDTADENLEDLAYTQRLKAAVHYTTGKITEDIGEETGLTFSKHFISVLADTTFKFSQRMASDLELFAKHGKRSTINSDDIKLLVRKSPHLLEHISNMSKELSAANEKTKRSKKSSRPRTKKKTDATSSTVDSLDEDSNM